MAVAILFALLFLSLSADACQLCNTRAGVELLLFGVDGWELQENIDISTFLHYAAGELQLVFGSSTLTMPLTAFLDRYLQVRGHSFPVPSDITLLEVLGALPGVHVFPNNAEMQISRNGWWVGNTPHSSVTFFPVEFDAVADWDGHRCTEVNPTGCGLVRDILMGMHPYPQELILAPECRHNLALLCHDLGHPVLPQDIRLLPGFPLNCQYPAGQHFLELGSALTATAALEYISYYVAAIPQVLAAGALNDPLGRGFIRAIRLLSGLYRSYVCPLADDAEVAATPGEALPGETFLVPANEHSELPIDLSTIFHSWGPTLHALESLLLPFELPAIMPRSLESQPHLVSAPLASGHAAAQGPGQGYHWDGLLLPLRVGSDPHPNSRDPRSRIVLMSIFMNIARYFHNFGE